MAGKVLTVVGARPQFIKAAVVSHAFAETGNVEESIVHTGQHYDHGMSQVFFDELDIPEPKINLGVSGGSHAQMTARMLVALEEVMLKEKPDCILLYGDTNSTLAAALAAAKLHLPIAHVEAGTRTRSMSNPEEVNRVCTDHVSTLLLACTEGNLDNLEAESLGGRSRFVGDPMLDAFAKYRAIARLPRLSLLRNGMNEDVPRRYIYLTCHREENTANPDTLMGILEGVSEYGLPVVYPVHPRNAAAAVEIKRSGRASSVLFVEPVGYLESAWLTCHAEQVVTDSGGLQREAFFAGVKCTTVLDFEVWPETMVCGRNLLAKPKKESILSAMREPQNVDPNYKPFGDGNAAKRIAVLVSELANEGRAK